MCTSFKYFLFVWEYVKEKTNKKNFTLIKDFFFFIKRNKRNLIKNLKKALQSSLQSLSPCLNHAVL